MLSDRAAEVAPATDVATPVRHDADDDARLQVGTLTIDLRARQVHVDDRLVELPAREFDLLAYLAARPGHVFSRDQLLRAVWQSQPEWQQVATVTEHIGRLRTKIEADPRQPRILTTVRGAGYRLDLPAASAASAGSDVSAALRQLVTGVLSELTDAVIITDVDSRLRSWNTAAERLYGWREHEVIGRRVLDVVKWVGDDGALAATLAGLEADGRWKGEGRQITRDGSVISVLASTTLIRDDAGAPVLIVSVNRPTSTTAAALAAAATAEEAYDDDRFRSGLAADEFEVFYQPVVALDDLRVVTMEALVRWNHPTRGLLAPAAFIAAAERSGSVIELGNVVLERACGQVAEWRRSGIDVELSVNLSPRQLSDPALLDRVTTVLAFTGLAPGALWLEVTETALVDDVDRASAVLHQLADLGIRIAIDDFGTGWASLTYLSRFPIHALKIDRSFVAGVGRNAYDTAIARSILSLGAELGIAVIAEGIETTAQQLALQKLGCSTGQGFLYGRPSPASTAPTHRAGRIEAQIGPAERPGGDTPSDTVALLAAERGPATGAVEELLRGLLRIGSAKEAAGLLHHAIGRLGGIVVDASSAGADALAVDVSLGQGPAQVVMVGTAGDRRELSRLLPTMADDAHHAVGLLRQTARW